MADNSFADNSQDFIIDQWTTVDVSSLVDATELSFSLATTDEGPFGPNTPLYFALDDLVVSEAATAAVPEPTSF